MYLFSYQAKISKPFKFCTMLYVAYYTCPASELGWKFLFAKVANVDQNHKM